MKKIQICCRVSEEVLDFIVEESSRRYPAETGGMLIGRWGEEGLSIEKATGPGPNAKHSPWGFRRDGDHSQVALDEIVRASEGKIDYVGEWHSHPANHGLSTKDTTAMRWIASNEKYAIAQPVLGLCIVKSEDAQQVSFYLLDGEKLYQLEEQE